VLNVIAAMMLTNAYAKSEQLIVVFINLIFITIISFLVLAFFGSSSLKSQFWPFTHVQNGKEYAVTGKMASPR
jgi:uncharacterized membrane protein